MLRSRRSPSLGCGLATDAEALVQREMADSTASRNRMVVAAATLFARAGFHGVTTRDIAQSANVSEGNIFRYFPSKRELFMAAIDHELGKLQSRTATLEPNGDEDDSRAALQRFFELITETVVDEPGLVRLLHFSFLEFGSEIAPVYRKHLDGLLQACTANFTRWARNERWRNLDPQVTVLSFVATVVLLQLYPALTGADLPFASVKSAAAAYAELWYRVLCEVPAA
jgi:AcrR family transcriptional regulator